MSYKLAGVIWNDDGTMATKELTPLEAFGELKRQIGSLPYTRFDLSGGIGQITTFLIRDTKLYEIIETALKALEIIKETRVDTNIIKESKDYVDYCGFEAQKMLALMFSAPKQKGITEEQYNLLKEILK